MIHSVSKCDLYASADVLMSRVSVAFGICVRREAHFVSVGLPTYHPDKPLNRLPVLITVVGK